MGRFLKIICKYLTMFTITGSIYYLIEYIWKRLIIKCNSELSWRMFALSGILCLIIGMLNNIFTYEADFLLQSLVGSLLITLSEGIAGYQWNTIEHLNIWDYSNLMFSFIAGNICVEFTILAWVPLSAITIVFMDYLDWKWFGYMSSTPPYYKIFGKKIFQFRNR